ncbi:hypothetical protein AB0F91_22610 [Amycolatopsis sp. NPDC023774]|uniref:hypothetical protein n=1 Tax=Amycolatopsis sp. NPDC023774 TaxID=3155015 RepID=UPI0033D1200A
MSGVPAVAQLVRAEYDSHGLSLLFVADLLWTVELVLLIAASGAFRVPSRRRRRKPLRGGPDGSFARLLLGRNGGSTIAWMTTWPQNAYSVASDGASRQMCDNSGLVLCVSLRRPPPSA